MGKISCRWAVVLALLLLVTSLLVACKPTDVPVGGEQGDGDQLSAPEDNSPLDISPRKIVWSGLELDSQVREGLTVLLERAELVGHGVFGESCLDYDTESPHMVGYKLYYPVTDARFPSFAELVTYLERVYVPEYIDLLLERGDYIEVDGVLYVNVGESAGNMKAQREYIEAEVTRITDLMIIANLKQHYRRPEGELATYGTMRKFAYSKGRWLLAPFSYELFVWSGPEISPAQQARFEALVKQHDSINDSMFQLDSLSYDESCSVQVNDRPYYLVTDPRFPNLESLLALLRETYNEEFMAWYLGREKYLEVDGRLYTYGGAAGWPPEDLIDATIMEVFEATDTLVIVRKEQTKEFVDGTVFKDDHMYKFVREEEKWVLAPYYDLTP